MSDNMESRLFARFPWLRAERPQFGFECGDGWEKLLIDFFATVDEHCPGGHGFHILQIKEKMGTLRFYFSLGAEVPDATHAAIRDALLLAEGRSAYTCERCGERGQMRNASGYYHVACDAHAEIEGRTSATVPDKGFLVGGKAGWRRFDPDLDTYVDVEVPSFD